MQSVGSAVLEGNSVLVVAPTVTLHERRHMRGLIVHCLLTSMANALQAE